MSEKRLFIDTSFYLGFLLGEASARVFSSQLVRRTLCASTLMVMEAERNLVRLSREKVISEETYQKAFDQLKADIEKFLLRDFTFDLCLTGGFPPVRLPRTSDLIHLRTARWFHENGGVEGFLTLDRQQKESARDFGLPIIEKP